MSSESRLVDKDVYVDSTFMNHESIFQVYDHDKVSTPWFTGSTVRLQSVPSQKSWVDWGCLGIILLAICQHQGSSSRLNAEMKRGEERENVLSTRESNNL